MTKRPRCMRFMDTQTLMVLLWSLLSISAISVVSSWTGGSKSLLPEFIESSERNLNIPQQRLYPSSWPPAPLGHVAYVYRVSHASSATQSSTQQRQSDQLFKPLYPVPNRWLDANGTLLPQTIEARERVEVHCLASTDFGAVLSRPLRLPDSDQPTPPTTRVQYVSKGSTVGVPCDYASVELPGLVQFSHNGSILPRNTTKYLVLSAEPNRHREGVLLIDNFHSNDQGIYQCHVHHPEKNVSGNRFDLRLAPANGLQTNPSVVGDFQPIMTTVLTAMEGQNVTLICLPWSLREHEPISIRRGYQFPHSMRRNLQTPSASWPGILSIPNVRQSDSDTYYCSCGNWTSTLVLNVHSPPIVTINPRWVVARRGQMVRLTCTASHDHHPPVWFHNGRQLVLSKSATDPNISLRIDDLQDEQIGVYQCVQLSADGEWISDVAVLRLMDQPLIRRVDMTRLHTEPPSTILQPVSPTKFHARIGQTLPLYCISPLFDGWMQTNQSELRINPLAQLAMLFPTRGNQTVPSTLTEAVRLAVWLRELTVEWRKDGVPLQLGPSLPFGSHPNESISDRLMLHLAQSSDFGVYMCSVRTRRIPRASLYTNKIVVAPERVWSATVSEPTIQNTGNISRANPMDAVAQSMTDRGKRNAAFDMFQMPTVGKNLASGDDVWMYPTKKKDQSQQQSVVPFQSGSFTLATQLTQPQASLMGDNLAINVTWAPVLADYYRIQFRHRQPTVRRWSKPRMADGTIDECCGRMAQCCEQYKNFFFTRRQLGSLVPGLQYQFRVLAFTGNGPSPSTRSVPSRWSLLVSLEHISKVAPVFTKTERLLDGSIVVRWRLDASAVGFSIDHFLLLHRMEHGQIEGKVTYHPFKCTILPDSAIREFKLEDLKSDKGYQLVVYGVHNPPNKRPEETIFTGPLDGRRITLFSHEVFVGPLLTDATAPIHGGSDLTSVTTARRAHDQTKVTYNSLESNQLMFIILGSLTGVMLIVILCLVVLCVCRQTRKPAIVTTSVGGGQFSQPWPGAAVLEQRNYDPNSGFMLAHLSDMRRGNVDDGKASLLSHPLSSSVRSADLVLGSPHHPPPGNPAPPPPLRHPSTVGGGGGPQLMVYPNYPGTAVADPAGAMNPYGGAYPSQTAWDALTRSQYSGQMLPLSYAPHPHLVSHATPPGAVPPFGLKREPPSGGSMHEETDTEDADVLDYVIQPIPQTRPGFHHPGSYTHQAWWGAQSDRQMPASASNYHAFPPSPVTAAVSCSHGLEQPYESHTVRTCTANYGTCEARMHWSIPSDSTGVEVPHHDHQHNPQYQQASIGNRYGDSNVNNLPRSADRLTHSLHYYPSAALQHPVSSITSQPPNAAAYYYYQQQQQQQYHPLSEQYHVAYSGRYPNRSITAPVPNLNDLGVMRSEGGCNNQNGGGQMMQQQQLLLQSTSSKRRRRRRQGRTSGDAIPMDNDDVVATDGGERPLMTSSPVNFNGSMEAGVDRQHYDPMGIDVNCRAREHEVQEIIEEPPIADHFPMDNHPHHLIHGYGSYDRPEPPLRRQSATPVFSQLENGTTNSVCMSHTTGPLNNGMYNPIVAGSHSTVPDYDHYNAALLERYSEHENPYPPQNPPHFNNFDLSSRQDYHVPSKSGATMGHSHFLPDHPSRALLPPANHAHSDLQPH